MPRQSAQERDPDSPAATTALALRSVLTPKNKKKTGPPSPTRSDRRRWFMFMGKQMPIEEIADHEGVKPIWVQRSIDTMKEYRHWNSNESVALRVNEVVLGQMPHVARVFSDGLKAKKTIVLGAGKSKDVPDHAMRLKTVDTIKSLQELAQPRVPLVQNNTQFNNNNGGGGGGEYQPGMSFESRLRLAREKRGLRNEEEVDDIQDAEEDSEESVEEELSGIGIDLNDGEGEDADTA